MATPKIRSACAAPVSTLAPSLPRTLTTPCGRLELGLYAAPSLSPRSQDVLYSLLDANMAPLAQGTSMEHSELAKRTEMFDRDARYLALSREPEDRNMPGSLPEPGQEQGELGDVLGFASFRFDTEETLEPDDVEVVYCYEVQLVPSARGAGLGQILMAELERIGKSRGMKKAMLTCLANNTAGLRFYEKAGYTPDEIDPTRIAEEDGWEDVDEEGEVRKPDYRILSKLL